MYQIWSNAKLRFGWPSQAMSTRCVPWIVCTLPQPRPSSRLLNGRKRAMTRTLHDVAMGSQVVWASYPAGRAPFRPPPRGALKRYWPRASIWIYWIYQSRALRLCLAPAAQTICGGGDVGRRATVPDHLRQPAEREDQEGWCYQLLHSGDSVPPITRTADSMCKACSQESYTTYPQRSADQPPAP